MQRQKGGFMKVKVVKRFVDKNTKEMREVGKVYEYPEKRAKELIDGGYAEEAKAANTKKEG